MIGAGVRARAMAKMHTYVHYLLTVCAYCMLDQYPAIFSIATLYVAHSMLAYFHCLDTEELWFMLVNPQACAKLLPQKW